MRFCKPWGCSGTLTAGTGERRRSPAVHRRGGLRCEARPGAAGAARPPAGHAVRPLSPPTHPPPCTFSRCFNRDKQGGAVKLTELSPTAAAEQVSAAVFRLEHRPVQHGGSAFLRTHVCARRSTHCVSGAAVWFDCVCVCVCACVRACVRVGGGDYAVGIAAVNL